MRVTQADGRAEARAAEEMAREIPGGTKRVTLGMDKCYGWRETIEPLRELNVTAHVAQRRASAVDGRTTRHEGYWASQRRRKVVEESCGWLKTAAGMRKMRWRGQALVELMFTMAAAGYDLVRLRNLLEAAA